MNKTFLILSFSFAIHFSFVSPLTSGVSERHKAMYLVNLVRNIDWDSDEIIIGVVGNSEVSTELETLVRRNTKIQVRVIEDLTTVTECNIVFLPDATNSSFFLTQEQIADNPILLVVDKKQMVVRGAEMGFYEEDNKLKIAMNPDEIEKTGIKISHALMEKVASMN